MPFPGSMENLRTYKPKKKAVEIQDEDEFYKGTEFDKSLKLDGESNANNSAHEQCEHDHGHDQDQGEEEADENNNGAHDDEEEEVYDEDDGDDMDAEEGW